MQGGMELSDRGLSRRIDGFETGLLFPPFSQTPKGGSRGFRGRARASSRGFVSLRARRRGAKGLNETRNRCANFGACRLSRTGSTHAAAGGISVPQEAAV